MNPSVFASTRYLSTTYREDDIVPGYFKGRPIQRAGRGKVHPQDSQSSDDNTTQAEAEHSPNSDHIETVLNIDEVAAARRGAARLPHRGWPEQSRISRMEFYCHRQRRRRPFDTLLMAVIIGRGCPQLR